MAYILQQSLVGLLHHLQTGRHGVKIGGQLAEFIMPLGHRPAYPGTQFSGRDFAAGVTQFLQRPGQGTRQKKTDQGADQGSRKQA